MKSYGIHHVSSIVGHAQENLDFMNNVLGLRLVKQTLNYDDPNGIHLYFGNKDASINIYTTFPLNDAVKGRLGKGQIESTQFAIPRNSLEFWKTRLTSYDVKFEEIEEGVRFKDPSDLILELKELDVISDAPWEFNGVTKEVAIVGIHSVRLLSRRPEDTIFLLRDIFGYEVISKTESITTLKINDEVGGLIEILNSDLNQGLMGIGTVHHVALRVNDKDLENYISQLTKLGYKPTEIKQRNYFKSVYFRDKGGIIFELANESPGMIWDESIETLGSTFIIPPHFKDDEENILANHMPLEVKKLDQLQTYSYRNRYEYDLIQKKEALKKKINILNELEKTRQLTEEEYSLRQQLREEFVKVK